MNLFNKIISILALNFCISLVVAEELPSNCRAYTDEQKDLLFLAYEVGQSHDLGWTLAAIVQKESFIGEHVARVNVGDMTLKAMKAVIKRAEKTGKIPDLNLKSSFGVTQIQLSTAMYLNDENDYWKARTRLATRLIYDDQYAMKTTVKKLLSVRPEGSEVAWREMVSRYNGIGKDAHNYMKSVASILNELRRCKPVLDITYLPPTHWHSPLRFH